MSIEYGEFEDWRGEKADPTKHGGVRASSIACGKLAFRKKKKSFLLT